MPGPVKLGIAVTTFNRREMLLAQVEALLALTSGAFELVVCDDGSSDGTVGALRARDVTVIGGVNRGIAWNKNRGLFYLREILGCDVILLLDDDVLPVEKGWEQAWVEAVARHGHINWQHPNAPLIDGAGTAADPCVSDKLLGQCVAFSRRALSYVGYMDTRFKGYGHEHTDLTKRAIRAGFGGFTVRDGETRFRFYAMGGGLRLLPSASSGDPESIARNERVMHVSADEPIYRNAWRTEEEYETLRAEMAGSDGLPAAPRPEQALEQPAADVPAPDGNLARGRRATQSSVSQWSNGTAEQDAAGAVAGQPDGKRNFHTGHETAPWWQVDLGAPRTISEIRIYNTLEPVVRERFARFSISVAFDPDDWIEVFRKEDDETVGGIDGHPFVWKPDLSAFAQFVRITLDGPGFLHLDQVEVYGPGPLPPVRAKPAPTGGAGEAALFSRFISLGDNCEFGMVQRAAGLEPLDLLRFGGTGDDEAGLILALRERFAAFGTDEDLRFSDDGGEWIAWSRRYQVSFHTHRRVALFREEQMRFELSKRLRFQADKMVEDLTAARHVFIRKSNKPVAAETMFELRRAMAAYGDPVLLWVTADAAAHAAVTELAPGFYRGHIRRLAPYEDATDVRPDDWRELCEAALAAIGSRGATPRGDEAAHMPQEARLASQSVVLRSDPVPGQAVNLARGGVATQSSVSEWSRGATVAEDAAGAVDGNPDGTRKFHTAGEDAPWWQVDLGSARTIAALRIYNTVDPAVRRRFERFHISVAFEGRDDWIEVYRKDDDKEIGGINGNPFFWRPELSVFGRFLRVTANTPGFLHLDQVEVYGPGEIPPSVVGPDGALFAKFISLGDNCEFGIVQHEAGVVSHDLLRYGGGTDDEALTASMRERFATFGDASDIEIFEDPLHEWQSGSRGCKVRFHTFRFSSEVDRETITARESYRLRFLANKLVGDIEAAEKIFVRRADRPAGAATVLALHEAMRRIGKATLLWVSLADATHPHASVDEVAPGVLRGYIRRLAPEHDARDVHVDDWRELCRAALAAAGQEA